MKIIDILVKLFTKNTKGRRHNFIYKIKKIMKERVCKQCGADISDKNMNTIFCNQNCRTKWRYHNEEGLKDKKKDSTYKRRHKIMLEKVAKEELERVRLIKMIKNLE